MFEDYYHEKGGDLAPYVDFEIQSFAKVRLQFSEKQK